VEQAEADSVIERGESLMLQRVVHLGDTVAAEVQVPRTDMVTLEQGTGLERAMRLHLRSGFSRVPVVGRDADDVVGVSYLKDVAAHVQDLRTEGYGDPSRATVDEVMRAPVFVPESKPADDLLRDMQAGSVHLAVVIDEYGGVSGLVTIEDLLEEIVGQISDEYDVEEPEIEVLGPDRWRLSARTHLTALSEITDRAVEDDDVDTVAGLLAKNLGRVPIRGSSVEVAGLRVTADRPGPAQPAALGGRRGPARARPGRRGQHRPHGAHGPQRQLPHGRGRGQLVVVEGRGPQEDEGSRHGSP
jgi:CBS domain containing-hemolysin-like protein